MRVMPFISIVILAAGESSRMGQPKQTLPWEGTTLLQYQVQQAGRTQAREVIVVLGGEESDEYRRLLPVRLEGPRLIVIENQDYSLGKTTSVKAGVRAIDSQSEHVVMLAADSPRPAAVLDRLMTEHVGRGSLITYPSYRGREGHPPVLSMALREEVMAISEERRGLREVAERDPARVLHVEFDDPLVIVNMNSPEDYERALRLTGQATPR
jgi:molybdenum cofactor cytidylyltransferase